MRTLCMIILSLSIFSFHSLLYAQDKTGVLLISHGSKSKTWRTQLLELKGTVEPVLLGLSSISEVKVAFMEDASPSIAEQMRAFDRQGFKQVIAVPLFLTVELHSSHDIPNILGTASDPGILATLKKNGTEIYHPRARITLTTTLDYQQFLQQNVLKRVARVSSNSRQEGIVLVAYGSSRYNGKWEAMMESLGRSVYKNTGIDAAAYAWCGHVVDYSPDDTRQAINKILEQKDQVIVIPMLLAKNPFFMDDIIQSAVDTSTAPERVSFKQEGILPDEALTHWILKSVKSALGSSASNWQKSEYGGLEEIPNWGTARTRLYLKSSSLDTFHSAF